MNIVKKILFLLCISLLLTGCSTLTYVGDDYVVNNTQTIRTDENFVFNTYKKSIGDINVKAGISKTTIQEILVLYLQIENYSYDNPYYFKVDDLKVTTQTGNIPFITSNNYLSIWQSQEAAAMAQMGAMGGTLSAMTGMNAGYNEINQGMLQEAAQKTNESAFNQLDLIGNKILKHSVKISSTVNPRKSQYYYFFFEDTNEEVMVKYKNLEYKFKI